MQSSRSLRSSLHLFAPVRKSFVATQARWLHSSKPAPTIPQPRPFVPDVKTFLTLIGRGLSKQASKFPSWESLFTLSSNELKELGIEPPRTRRYLLNWLNKYRRGIVGPGGDLQYVKDGEALLKVATPPASTISQSRWVVNVPHEEQTNDTSSTLVRPAGYSVRGLNTVCGPFSHPLPGRSGAIIKATEGMWEDRRGRKIDGGERRRAEVRFKRRIAERRAQREAEMALGH